MIPLLTKFGLPAFILTAGFGAGMITSKKLEKPVEIPRYECPACNCPPQANTIDFEKIKGFKGTINLNQTYQISVDGDSLAIKQFQEAVRNELVTLKVTRCRN
jgi:hypothetical protein